jgi:hypothetical protein
LYSINGVLSGAGPTIVGNVRTGTTFSAVAPRWAIGNLNGLYGYGTTTYGTAFGDASATNVTIDATNGFRIRNGTTNKLAADTAGNLSLTGDLSIGSAGAIRSSSATSLFTGDGFYMTGGATPTFRIGNPAGNRFVYDAGSGIAAFYGDASGATNINVGAGRNMIRNSDCAVSTADWVSFTSSAVTFTLGFALSPWRLGDSSNTCYITSLGTPVSSTQSAAYLGENFHVIEGHRYEASAYLGVHRSGDSAAWIQWFNAAGTQIGTSTGNACTTASPGGTTLSGYCRSGVISAAPAGAVTARPVLTTTHNGGSNPYLFFVHTYFGEALSSQTEFTPWGPAGATEIIGGLIKTGTIVADNISAGAITATKIAAGTITASQIATGTITATQIAGSTITGGNIAAGTITADKLSVSSLSAVTADLGTITAGSISLNAGQFVVDTSGNVTARSFTIPTGANASLVGNLQLGTAIVFPGVSNAFSYYSMCITNDSGTMRLSLVAEGPCS